MERGSVFVKLTHNMEIAHRLYRMPGKCQQIHGHSMKVDLTLHGYPNANGVFEGRDFGDMKKVFREFLNDNYDHHLLLNKDDPWAGLFHLYDPLENDPVHGHRLPGLVICKGDPTTENLCRWILDWAHETYDLSVDVYIQETGTNGVGLSKR
jgi:6-pyruvoyltetrahydropterin/6-carboxytetrahydropterin synthase